MVKKFEDNADFVKYLLEFHKEFENETYIVGNSPLISELYKEIIIYCKNQDVKLDVQSIDLDVYYDCPFVMTLTKDNELWIDRDYIEEEGASQCIECNGTVFVSDEYYPVYEELLGSANLFRYVVGDYYDEFNLIRDKEDNVVGFHHYIEDDKNTLGFTFMADKNIDVKKLINLYNDVLVAINCDLK